MWLTGDTVRDEEWSILDRLFYYGAFHMELRQK
jgi:hypothetical protein